MIINPSYDFDSKGNIFGITKDEFHEPRHISKLVHIQVGPGSFGPSLLQYTGAVQIIEQFAKITAITTLVNATNVYASAWDGTNAPDLTLDGADISGFEVGSFFLKDLILTSPYTVMNGDQGRVNENLDTKKAGKTFILNAKNGVDNFINFYLTTTDAPIDFWMKVHFGYRKLTDDASLAFL